MALTWVTKQTDQVTRRLLKVKSWAQRYWGGRLCRLCSQRFFESTGGYGSAAWIRGLRMQSLSRHPLPVDAGHLRTTAVANADLLEGFGEGQVRR